MESYGAGTHVHEANARAARMRTRKHAQQYAKKESEREFQKGGLSQNEYWVANVRSRDDIVKFYSIYYPDYPECLAKSIAERVASIVEKSQAGKQLTAEEKAYYHRSILPAPQWDPTEELKEHEKIAKVNLTIKRLEELKTTE